MVVEMWVTLFYFYVFQPVFFFLIKIALIQKQYNTEN